MTGVAKHTGRVQRLACRFLGIEIGPAIGHVQHEISTQHQVIAGKTLVPADCRGSSKGATEEDIEKL